MQAPFGLLLKCRPLAAIADHFFTTASLTLEPASSEWSAIAEQAGLHLESLRLLRQVHGRDIVDADARAGGWQPPEADGIVSSDPAVALVVRVADCAPILIGDRRIGAVAAVHAGWRSTMQRIVAAAVERMQARYGSRPADLVAAIGPSLGRCCGEMGNEVIDAFRAAGHPERAIERWFAEERGRPHFDLWRANVDQLCAAGVPGTSVHVSGLCTRSHPDVFHSYRAMGRLAGRMAAVIRANGSEAAGHGAQDEGQNSPAWPLRGI